MTPETIPRGPWREKGIEGEHVRSCREGVGAEVGQRLEGPPAQASPLQPDAGWEQEPGNVGSWWSTSPHASPDPALALALPGTQTRFSQEPADQTVVAGQRAVLPCVLLNYSGIVQWTKDGLALGMGQGLKGEWGHPASPASRLSPLWAHHPSIPQNRLLDSEPLLCAPGSSPVRVGPAFFSP